MTRTILAAATAALLAATAAQAQQVELVTGIGFGNSKGEAQAQAVKAWVLQAYRDYGFGDWNTAARFGMECRQMAQGGGASTMSIGVEGDVTGSWSCSVSGIPAGAG